MRKLFIPVLIVFAAGCAFADTNVFGLSNITIDPTYTAPAYPGFPLTNMFGGMTLTPENTYDTIFNDGSPGYQNVFFHLNSLAPLNGPLQITVTGAQDGPTNPSRSFTYFDLYSYTFTDINNPLTYTYKLLFTGTPTTVNGFETLMGSASLSNAGPYFIYQFGSDLNAQYTGSRIYGVDATVPEPVVAFLPFAVLSAYAFSKLRRRRSA